MTNRHFPEARGLYDPRFEHDSCGVGFVCQIKGEQSHTILQQGLTVLKRMSHRGAVGADPDTGDGAGILLQMPHGFLKKIAGKEGIVLPEAGEYGTGTIFLPPDEKEYAWCRKTIDKIIREEKQAVLGWRKVPVDKSVLGKGARASAPVFEQVFIGQGDIDDVPCAFERKLYIIRKRIENAVRSSDLKQKTSFYVVNISSRTLSYKGLLTPEQVEVFFPDLQDKDMHTAIALVHSRYSTNTFPTWDLAQPFRFLAHNGEINTLRGNINWMRAREGFLAHELFGKDIEKLKPVIVPGGSDSASLDNMFELLVLSGRSLAHAMMMLIPPAWEKDSRLDRQVKEFYQYHACFMEPWDGPASIAFTDGTGIGAVLDRNGLRPSRYLVTKDDVVIMSSEVGVLDTRPENIVHSGRLRPGKMFYIDTEQGCIVDDDEIKHAVSTARPYGEWVKKMMVDLDTVSRGKKVRREKEEIIPLMTAFGYTREDLQVILGPMAETGKEPIGSMGNDTPHAVLSKNPQVLYNYFKQLFAQVTNPAIDPIREDCVMSLESFFGPQQNILEESPEHCHRLLVKEPLLTDDALERIRKIDRNGFRTKTISTLFDAGDAAAFGTALARVCAETEKAIYEGYSFVILSDRGVNRDNAALPALLATSAVHQYLLRKELRTRLGIIVECGDAREVHHFALLFGYGADGVDPYLAYEAVRYLAGQELLAVDAVTAVENYREAVTKGILKILSKMGISTLQSYRGAQIFEALGLEETLVEQYFSGTVSRIGGADIDIIAEETIRIHRAAYEEDGGCAAMLPSGGVYQWKKDGEFHLWNPETIAALQDAVRTGDYDLYKKFAQKINDQSLQPTTLRSLLKFKKGRSVPIDEVEAVESIVKRFVTGAMSFGSISGAAHETLAIAMNRLGGKSNTGEGGEDPVRFVPLANGDSKRSATKQVASGRFGVTANYLINADEIQIKIAQGAKPGEGGQLPGHKVSTTIARIRFTTPGVTLISPPPHHDIYSIEDLAQLIFDLKNTNPAADINVKLVSECGVGTVAAGVAKGHADVILISGGDGGTGASPRSSIRHAGLPWELGLAETHQTLVLNDLRTRVRLQTDGQMRTGRDVAIAALLGAEEYGFCSAVLVVAGCVMLRHCHLNNCSLGVATQDAVLQKRFRGRPEYVEQYFYFVAREMRELMAELGVRTIDELIGRTDLLEVDNSRVPWKARHIDFSRILYKPEPSPGHEVHCTCSQEHNITSVLDKRLIEHAQPAIVSGTPVRKEFPIGNTDRTAGAMLSGKVCARYGEEGLPEDTIRFKFTGVAGQSFAAWLAQGITFELEGLANDYVGKGLSGGKVIVYPHKKAGYANGDNILIGNTTFYGAIRGEAYIRGVAGERFCIRNSGVLAVVEGVGDHGCEYMTGGRVVILGKTGINFAAGMSGGIVYVYDEDRTFKERCNMSMVELGKLTAEDEETVSWLLHNHAEFTGSTKARKILDDFSRRIKKFVRVIPLEYKRVLEIKAQEEKMDMAEVSDG